MITKKSKPQPEISRSEQYLAAKQGVAPLVSPQMARSVSQYRNQLLEEEVDRGLYRDGSATNSYAIPDDFTLTKAGVIKGSSSLSKFSQFSSSTSTSGAGGVASTTASGYRGPGGTVRQVPEVYSPLWLLSNLNLPRDRATINAWCRSFFALNPVVQNAITLHSTYPIAKLNIKCSNPRAQKIFEDQINEADLLNVCSQIAQEYWCLGEAVAYGVLDEGTGRWSKFLLQNPDYIVIKKSPVSDDPIISLRADENLRRICQSNRASDVAQRQQLDPKIVEYVRKGENIPMSNLYVSHLARKIAPYEVRGTSLITSVFRQLMIFDCLRECYSDDTEVLTDQGFKKIWELIELTNKQNVVGNYINGALIDETGKLNLLTMKEDFKVACFNKETWEVEFHQPEELHMSNYTGKMLHFNGKKVDCLVSPNHKMWAKEKHHKDGWEVDYELIPASKMAEKKKWFRFKSQVQWPRGKTPEYKEVLGVQIPIKTYLKVLGYMASEGCIYQNFKNGRYDALMCTSQLTQSDCYEDMHNSFNQFAELLDRKCHNYIDLCDGTYSNKEEPKDEWEFKMYGKDLTRHFLDEIGVGDCSLSRVKHLPRWVFELDASLLTVLLEALVKGDGTENKRELSENFRYSTTSKQLADDVYELVYRCGFAPNICISEAVKTGDRLVKEYIVLWSDTNYGNTPMVYGGLDSDHYGAKIDEVDYEGVVWCFTVPTGLFITRRNGKITVQGNSKFAQAQNMVNPTTLVKIGSADFKPTPADIDAVREVFEQAQYDKDFKIFTHDAVSIERVGWGQGIYDISGDITQLLKELYIGLMIPNVIIDGADITYANGSVALDVLKQRYMHFREILADWLIRKVFAPIAIINDLYEIEDGKKVLVLPEIDWNHMSLFDTSDYVNILSQLLSASPPKVSLQTVYRSLGLDYESEMRQIREEYIQLAIQTKEQESLMKMPLAEIRSLSEGDEIKEIKDALPGESGAEENEPPLPGTSPEGLPGLGGGPLGLGGPPPGGLGASPVPPPPGGAGGGGPPGGPPSV